MTTAGTEGGRLHAAPGDSDTLPPNTREVFAQLARAAFDMHTVTYTQLGAAVGIPPQGPWPQLTAISEVCLKRGLPWLDALVVHKADRRPGADWTSTWSDGTPLETEHIWRMAVSQVMAYPHWETVKF